MMKGVVATIQIGGDYPDDPKGVTYAFRTQAAYTRLVEAETAKTLADREYAKALGEPVIYPKGVCSFWIENVKLTGAIRDDHPCLGLEGDLNVIEVGSDGKAIIVGLFYPKNSKGYGEVVFPKFKRL